MFDQSKNVFARARARVLSLAEPSKASQRSRKSDLMLLDCKESVSFRTAEQYLGVGKRQIQKLAKDGKLDVVGMGHNRQITTDSLRKYLPPASPENTN